MCFRGTRRALTTFSRSGAQACSHLFGLSGLAFPLSSTLPDTRRLRGQPSAIRWPRGCPQRLLGWWLAGEAGNVLGSCHPL